MVYAFSRDAIRKKLDGVQVELQCNDESELDYNYGMSPISVHVF